MWVWTSHQLGKMEKVKTILEELKDYKPLTLRQVYYQLVSKGFIENKKSEYGMLSNLLKWARIDDYISWDDIEDRIRAVSYTHLDVYKRQFIMYLRGVVEWIRKKGMTGERYKKVKCYPLVI